MSAEEAETWSGRAKPGMPMFPGPTDVRAAFIKAKGIDWTASYIDPAIWISATRTIVTRTQIAYNRITEQGSFVCGAQRVTLRRGAPDGARWAA